jgi:predicted transcriptional regulator
MEAQTIATFTDIVTIVLSIVALIVTVIGFFASLKFYRDGVRLQNSANDALIRIGEKSLTIQTRVDGWFEKTLDAAIGKSEKLESSFEALNEQLEDSSKAIINNALNEIGSVGTKERNKIETVIKEQMNLLKERVNETRDNAVDAFTSPFTAFPITGHEGKILALLLEKGKAMTISEISNIVNLTPHSTSSAVGRLVGARLVKKQYSDGEHRFEIIKDSFKFSK